jgi:hypothetical protein
MGVDQPRHQEAILEIDLFGSAGTSDVADLENASIRDQNVPARQQIIIRPVPDPGVAQQIAHEVTPFSSEISSAGAG